MGKIQDLIARTVIGRDNLKALTSLTRNIGGFGSTIPVTRIGDTSEQIVNEGYGANEIVYSILTMAADKERMPPWAAYKIKDESSLKLYEIEMHKAGTPDFSVKKALDYRTKAIELYTRDGKLNNILQWPNENETFSDLVANSGVSKRATGNRFLKATLLDMGPNKGKPQELHLLPAQHVTIIASGTFPARALGYSMQLGTEHKYAREEVMHDKLYNPLYSVAGDDLYGLSPLQVSKGTLASYKSAKIAGVKSFDNLGPENVMYVDDPRMDAAESEAQLHAIRNKLDQLSGSRNRKKTALSAYKVGVAQLGLSPVDLAILESMKGNAITIANVYNFPHLLLIPDNSTYNNLKEAEKALTTRCALPYLVSFRNAFNRKLSSDWGYKGENIYIDFDLSVFSELHQDMKDLTTWLKDSWWLTPRMKYDMQQIDIPEAVSNMAELDMIFIPNGYSELSSLNADPLNDQLDEEDKNGLL